MRQLPRHFSKTIVVLILSLVVSSCGFHLRGQLPLPEAVNVIYIDADRSDFTRELEASFRAAGATLVDSPTQAKAILQIADEYAEREVLTLNTDGRATAYKLFYTVDYLLANEKQELLKEGRLVEQRQYSFDSGEAVRQESEENELLEEMYKELALKVVRQIGSL